MRRGGGGHHKMHKIHTTLLFHAYTHKHETHAWNATQRVCLMMPPPHFPRPSSPTPRSCERKKSECVARGSESRGKHPLLVM